MPRLQFNIPTSTPQGVDEGVLTTELAAVGVTAVVLISDDEQWLDIKTNPKSDEAVLSSTRLTVNAALVAHAGPMKLSESKTRKYNRIDKRTDELIAAGYTYDSKTFSLTPTHQVRLVGLFAVRDDAALTYPVKLNTKNNNNYVELATSADIRSIYLTALATLRGHLDSGSALKDAVRDATTVAEVAAVVDNR